MPHYQQDLRKRNGNTSQQLMGSSLLQIYMWPIHQRLGATQRLVQSGQQTEVQLPGVVNLINTSIQQIIKLYKTSKGYIEELATTLRIFYANRGIEHTQDLIDKNNGWKGCKEITQAITNPRAIGHTEFAEFHLTLTNSDRCEESTIVESKGWSWEDIRSSRNIWIQPNKIWANKLSSPQVKFNKLNEW